MSDNEGIICLICSDNCLNNYVKYPLKNGSCKCVYYIHLECQTIMNNQWGKKCPICSKIKNNSENETKVTVGVPTGVIVEVAENSNPTTDIIVINENENIVQRTNNFRHEMEQSPIYCKNFCIICLIILFISGFITIVCTVSTF